MTTTNRAVATVKIIVDRTSLGGIDMGEYLARLEAAVRAMPGVTEDTEIDVLAGDHSRYEGLYVDSQPWQYDALTAVAEGVFSEMCRNN